MATAFVAGNGSKVDASGTEITVTVAGVSAGNLVVGIVKWEGSNVATLSTLTDGTSSIGTGIVLDPDGKVSHSNNDLNAQCFYHLASAASGSVTYTANLSAAREWKQMAVGVFSYSGTANFDNSVSHATDSSAGTVATSPAITLTGSDIVAVAFWGNYVSNTPGNHTINAVADDAVFGNADGTQGWYRLLTAGFAGGTATLDNVGGTIPATMHQLGFFIEAAGGATARLTRSHPLGMHLGLARRIGGR